MTVSVVGADTPHGVAARRRTKYVPGGAWAAKVVTGQPVSKVPTFVSATDVPASTT
jgi:hypothetical protein